MKSFSCWTLLLLLLCTLSCPVRAEAPSCASDTGDALSPPSLGGPSLGGPGEETPDTIVRLTGQRPAVSGSTTMRLLLLTPGEPLTALETNPHLPHELDCLTDAVDSQGQPVSAWCPVTWELSETPDSMTPGRFSFFGTLKPPPGFELAQDFSGRVCHTAVITGERPLGPEMLESVADTDLSAMLLPLGQAPETYFNTTEVTCFTRVPGEYFFCPVVWDFHSVQQDVLGAYSITGVPELPTGFAPPPDFKPLTRSLIVMDANKVDLSAASFDPCTKLLDCHWIGAIAHETPVSLECAVGKGEWKPDDQEFLFYNPHIGDFLSVRLERLALKTDYYFRIVYGAPGAQKTSNVLHVRLESWDFLDTEGSLPPFDISGDRDGGDLSGDPLPDLEQPAPGFDTDDASQPLQTTPPQAPPLEVVTPTSTTLSGARLCQLMAQAETVLFEKQGVAVELSVAFLESLALQSAQLLEVTIERPTPETFRLRLFCRQAEIEALPDTTVRLPWTAAQVPVQCVDLTGASVSEGSFEPESNTVRVTIRATGTYRMQPVPSSPTAPHAIVSASASSAQRPAERPAEPQPPGAPAPAPAAPENAARAVNLVPEHAHPTQSCAGCWLLAVAVLLAAAAAACLLRRRHP